MDAGVGNKQGSLDCKNGTSQCGDRCIDLQSSRHHCGRCGNACGSKSFCISGTCKKCSSETGQCTGTDVGVADGGNGLNCDKGTTQCGNRCVDLQKSANHCGSCGHACADKNACQKGTCEKCNKTICGSKCVDLKSDIHNCGKCGHSCGSGGLYCGEGKCQCIQSGFTNCDGKCLDLQNDNNNCGACGNACAGGEKCEMGKCETLTRIQKVIQETNKFRKMGYDCDTEGVKPPTHKVTGNPELHKAAQAHAESMAKNHFFSHTYPPPDCQPGSDPGCHDFAWRIRQTNYSGQPGGENIARGQTSAQQVVQGWADSDGHCRNMMNSGFNEIGVGYAESNSTYWVQVFGKK